MGLDMYLYDKKPTAENCNEIKEVIYWRKANMIHRFFVENCQNNIDDCRHYPVTYNQLLLLKQYIETVINAKSEYISKKILPVEIGCFFGNTEYNEYYYQELITALSNLTILLNSKNIRKTNNKYDCIFKYDTDSIFYYHSSW